MTTQTQQHPFGTEIDADHVIALFNECQSWEDKYRHVIQLGKKLPSLDVAAKQRSVAVPGCESKVWLHWWEQDGTLFFEADSDARIVKGLLAIILAATHGKSPLDIRAFNFEHYFKQLDLLAHLSESRSNGINAIIKQVREI